MTNGAQQPKADEVHSTKVLGQRPVNRRAAALEAGATRDEIPMILKMASVLSTHSCSLGAPILLEEEKTAGVQPRKKTKEPTPACDKMKEIGQWNTAWDPLCELDPVWTDEFFTVGAGIYTGGVLSPKDVELLSIAFDASITHMYAPGTRRHIKTALKLGGPWRRSWRCSKIKIGRHAAQCSTA